MPVNNFNGPSYNYGQGNGNRAARNVNTGRPNPNPNPRTAAGKGNPQSKSSSICWLSVVFVVATRESRLCRQISKYKIQSTFFNTHFSTKIQIIFVSYLLFPPEEGAGRPPWNGAGAGRDGGGLLGRLLPPNKLKGFLKNCAEAQAKKSTAKVNNTFMVAKLRLKIFFKKKFKSSLKSTYINKCEWLKV